MIPVGQDARTTTDDLSFGRWHHELDVNRPVCDATRREHRGCSPASHRFDQWTPGLTLDMRDSRNGNILQ